MLFNFMKYIILYIDIIAIDNKINSGMIQIKGNVYFIFNIIINSAIALLIDGGVTLN